MRRRTAAPSAWRDAVDERLIVRCEQHERDGEELVFKPRLRTYAATPTIHVTPEDWGAGYLREPREVDTPINLLSDLHQLSPQSLLRDLFRPEYQLFWHRFEPIEGTTREPLKAIEEARQLRRVPMMAPRVEPIVRTVMAFMYWRIGMMRERWEPMLPDDSPRRQSPMGPVSE
jgi:hypothetical protein